MFCMCVFFSDGAEQICGGNDCGYPSSSGGYAQGAPAAGGEQAAATTTISV